MGEFRKTIEWIVREHGDYFSLMKEGKYTRGELGLSPRMGNYWIANDLFLDNSDKRNYRYNLLEALWIKLVQNLKKYNIQKDYILHLKKELLQSFTFDIENKLPEIKKKMLEEFSDVDPSQLAEYLNSEELQKQLKNLNYNVLELLLVLLVVKRDKIKILLSDKSEIVVVNESNGDAFPSEDNRDKINSMTHVSISLNQVLAEVLDSLPVEHLEHYQLVNEKEAKILQIMREGSPDSIEIIFDKSSKEPTRIQVTEENKVDSSARLNHLILANGYQDISVKTQNGQITHCKNTRKQLL